MRIDFSNINHHDRVAIGKLLSEFNINNKIVIIKNIYKGELSYIPRVYHAIEFRSLLVLNEISTSNYEVIKANKKKRFKNYSFNKTVNKYKIKKILLQNKNLIAVYDYKTMILEDGATDDN